MAKGTKGAKQNLGPAGRSLERARRRFISLRDIAPRWQLASEM
jgi:hypothetical protein